MKLPQSFIAIGAITFASFLLPWQALAGPVEISMGFSFNQSHYSEDSYSWNRRWGGSFGYHFSEKTQVELAYQDVFDRTFIKDYEDTSFHDQIYSANWIQAFTGKSVPVQPYFKIGIGQLNREAQGHYQNNTSPPAILDSLTGILGGGLRIYFTRTFAIRSELTSYLTGGSIRTYKDNTAVSFGLSLLF
ncbi:outer membrane beta-barrel protein [Bdellovibrionota bacterium FG-2]